MDMVIRVGGAKGDGRNLKEKKQDYDGMRTCDPGKQGPQYLGRKVIIMTLLFRIPWIASIYYTAFTDEKKIQTKEEIRYIVLGLFTAQFQERLNTLLFF